MDAEYGVVLHILDSCFLLLNRIFMAAQNKTKMVWILFFFNILLIVCADMLVLAFNYVSSPIFPFAYFEDLRLFSTNQRRIQNPIKLLRRIVLQNQ